MFEFIGYIVVILLAIAVLFIVYCTARTFVAMYSKIQKQQDTLRTVFKKQHFWKIRLAWNWTLTGEPATLTHADTGQLVYISDIEREFWKSMDDYDNSR